MNSIEVKDLTKKFGKFTSVDSISFNVKEAEIFGFLGANGAGKSTTIKMLCAILEPTSGDALIGGFSVKKQPEQVKKNIGYMSQKFSLYNDLTAEENINFFASIYGLSKQKLKERKKWILETSGLTDRKDSLTGTLAAGFKQRLALCCAVIHEPKIVFLDEPTSGVDPITRNNFWNLINELSEKGTAVFVTTHYLDEAEYCNRIMLIDSGKIIAGGTPAELKINYFDNYIIEAKTNKQDEAIKVLERNDLVKSAVYFGINLHITINKTNNYNTDEIKNILINQLQQHNINVFSMEFIQPSLEDIFVNLIEKD
jgi:ABC-2 type transport system ATP-binding protein